VFEVSFILAQQQLPDLGDLIWIVLVVLLPLLSGLGKWIRDRSASSEENGEAPDAAATPPTAHPSTKRDIASPEQQHSKPGAKPRPQRGPEGVLSRMFRTEGPSRGAEPMIVVSESGKPSILTPAHPKPAPQPRRQRERRVPPPEDRPPRARAVPRKRRVPEVKPAALDETVKHEAGRVRLSDWSSLSVAELRRAIVLKEVLGPPIALRDTQSAL